MKCPIVLQFISYKEGDTLTWSKFLRNSFRPVLMILGEFEYNATYDELKDGELGVLVRTFLALFNAHFCCNLIYNIPDLFIRGNDHFGHGWKLGFGELAPRFDFV